MREIVKKIAQYYSEIKKLTLTSAFLALVMTLTLASNSDANLNSIPILYLHSAFRNSAF